MWRTLLPCLGLVSLAIGSNLMPVVHAAEPPEVRSLDPRIEIRPFAESPQIVTPTGIDVDHRGRVWAVESNTHFRPEGYTGHPSDRVLVMSDTTGDGRADRIVTFADELNYTMSVAAQPSGAVYVATRWAVYRYHDDDGDDRADRRTRILHLDTPGSYPHDGLGGFAFDALGWMYVGLGENLGAPYTLIGVDGGRHSGGGEGGSLFRVRPDGTGLELWATGFWNPHASCVDAFGRLFTVDNDPDSRPPCRLLHIVYGGDYGYRFRFGRKGLHPFTAWNGELPGTLPMVSGTGEAPSGIVAYESDSLPPEYRGALLATSWGDHRIERYRLKRQGASFRSEPEVIVQGDENFRPVGLALAPDGSLYCTDWVLRDYELHGEGRVWRISATGSSRGSDSTGSDSTESSSAGDTSAIGSSSGRESGASSRTATSAETAEPTEVTENRPARVPWNVTTITDDLPVAKLKELLESPRMDVRRAAAGALAESSAGVDCLRAVLVDESLADRPRCEAAFALWKRLLDKSGKRQSPHGRLVPSGSSGDAACVRALLARPGTALARQVEAFECDVTADRETLERLLAKDEPFVFSLLLTALVENNSAEEIERRFIESRDASASERLLLLLAARRKMPKATHIVRKGFDDPDLSVQRASIQWAAAERLQSLRDRMARLLSAGGVDGDLFLATLAGLQLLEADQPLDGTSPDDIDCKPASEYLLGIVGSNGHSAAVRARALRMLSPAAEGLDVGLLKHLVHENPPTDAKGEVDQSRSKRKARPPARTQAIVGRHALASIDPLRLEAIRSLGGRPEPEAADLLERVAGDGGNARQLRAEAILGLAGALSGTAKNKSTVELLVRLVRDGDRPLRVEAIRTLRPHIASNPALRERVLEAIRPRGNGNGARVDPELAAQLALAWASNQETLPDWMAGSLPDRPMSIDAWTAALESGGDAEAGRRVFFHSNSVGCYRCHTVNGRGYRLGPDLSVVARTMDRRQLIESILEPNRELAPQFVTWTFVTTGGRVVNGMILDETDGRLRIATSEAEVLELASEQIEKRLTQKTSIMPREMVEQLTVGEFRDLLAFLETLK